MVEVILHSVSGYSYTYERGLRGGGGGGGGWSKVTNTLTNKNTENFSSPTNVSKSVTNAS